MKWKPQQYSNVLKGKVTLNVFVVYLNRHRYFEILKTMLNVAVDL